MMADQPVRPWGHFAVLHSDQGHKVKRLIINPGMRTSLQEHSHRREVWTVVRGSALLVINGEEVQGLPGQTFFVALGSVHRITNPGAIPLEIIEVQLGDCREDDIIRYDDDYGRVIKARHEPGSSDSPWGMRGAGYIPPL